MIWLINPVIPVIAAPANDFFREKPSNISICFLDTNACVKMRLLLLIGPVNPISLLSRSILIQSFTHPLVVNKCHLRIGRNIHTAHHKPFEIIYSHFVK